MDQEEYNGHVLCFRDQQSLSLGQERDSQRTKSQAEIVTLGSAIWIKEKAMTDQYHIYLEQLDLEWFQDFLEKSNLLPSEKILKEEHAQRFAILEEMGIKHLQDLTRALSTKKKLERFAQESGLPQEYLVILRRRANLYTPRPVPLKKMIGIDPEPIERLAAVGVKNTKQLFERARSKQDRAELSELANVPADVMLELVKLADLVRAAYVGPVYARIIYETGLDTLEKLAECPPEELLTRMHVVNEEKKLTKSALPTSVEEIVLFLEIVKMIPKVIEY